MRHSRWVLRQLISDKILPQMKQVLKSKDYLKSRVFPEYENIFDELEGNVKVFEKELSKFIKEQQLTQRLLKYDEENRISNN